MRDTLTRVRGTDTDEILPPWLIAAGSGAGAAVVSATLLVTIAVLGWLTGAGGDDTAGTTIAAGLAGWAFAHGAPLALDEGHIGLIPWLLTGWPLLCGWWSALRVVPARDASSPRLRGFGGVRQDVAITGGGFVAGYVLVAAVAAVGAHLGGSRPSIPLTLLGALVVALLAYALALLPRFSGHLGELAPRVAWARREYVPDWVTLAVRPALVAVALTLAAGLLVVLVAVALGFDRVAEVYARVGGGAMGLVLLTLAQLLYLPTLAVWGAAWLAGPGVTLGGGTAITWSQSEPGIIPLLPVLAAAPPPGELPAWMPVVVLAPVLIGIALGVWCVRRARRLGPTLIDAARVTGVAVVLYAIATSALAFAASGAVGAGRFAHVGVDAVATSLALTGEVGLAAFVVVGLSALLRRGSDDPVTDSFTDDNSAAGGRPSVRERWRSVTGRLRRRDPDTDG
ncbi:MAG: DUF6350 family protein [Mobilicoccus sp.]|nr:DUF6350 family protein [Mobilicoccus sp.]